MLDVDGNGDLVVLVEGDRWLLNPAAVTRVTDPEVVLGRNDSDHASEIPLGTTFQLDAIHHTHCIEYLCTITNSFSHVKLGHKKKLSPIKDFDY